jgi:hypothetical protein
MAMRIAIPAATLAIALMASVASPAQAASERVRNACRDDYFAFCSEHSPEGPGVRKCMNAHGRRLSPQCVSALVAAGEVSRAEVRRRKTASRR